MKALCKLAMVATGMAWSLQSHATCPPIVPCKVTAEASTIAGSNADRELIMFAQNITTTTNQVAVALTDMAKANAAAMGQSAQNIVATNAEMSQIQVGQELKIKKSLSDRKMAFDQQMTENAYRASTSVVSPDDTPEEYQVILDTLGEHSSKTVPEIILLLQETMDKNEENGRVLIQIPASKGVCSKEDVENEGKCAIAKRIFPAKKLEALFKQCSIDKRLLQGKVKQNAARVVATEISSKKTAKALEVSDSAGAVGARMERQLQLSCTPIQFKSNLCGGNSPEEYQESIVIGNIIPNGDVSASNFRTPSASSADGYITDMTDEAKKEIDQQSLDRTTLNVQPNQRVVPIVHTYRNANQVKASMDFIDNIVGDDLVSAVPATDRRKVANAEYQSRYLSRIAALSMVRLALTDSMTQRVGDKMRAMIQSGAFETANKFTISATSPGNKEDVLGAGPLDIIQDRVNQQSANLQLGDQNGLSANAGNDFVADPSKTDAMEKINEGILLQNEMLMREYLMNEQTIALEAISLVQKVNSPEMVKMMERMRRGMQK